MSEMVRIDKYRDYKKLNADTFFYTSKLFEFMARKSEVQNDLVHEISASTQNLKVSADNLLRPPSNKKVSYSTRVSPFRGRGIMEFDDYNYKSLNKLVF